MADVSAIEKAEEQLPVIAKDTFEGIPINSRKNLEVNIATLNGIPYKEIISFSDQNNNNLVVICTLGESGLTCWMLGSNTDKVIRGASVPVLAVPAIDVQKKIK